jgi:hypothetical protein
MTLIVSFLTAAPSTQAKDKVQINGTIAVLPLPAPTSLKVDHSILNEISEIFSEFLLKKKLRVQSTAYLRETLGEKDYSLDQLVREGKYLAIGNLAGTRYLLKVVILEWAEHRWFEHEGRIGLSAQILDARTGDVLWSTSRGKTITVFENKSMVVHLKRMIKDMLEGIQPGKEY